MCPRLEYLRSTSDHRFGWALPVPTIEQVPVPLVESSLASLRMTGLSWELAASLFGRAMPVAHHDSAVMSFSLPDMPPSVAMATTKVGSAARRSR